jgi:hypothetical protein
MSLYPLINKANDKKEKKYVIPLNFILNIQTIKKENNLNSFYSTPDLSISLCVVVRVLLLSIITQR